jgi:O-succinylbenzoic acid--CoA ligase
MDVEVVAVDGPDAPDLTALVRRLEQALDGSGPALLPVAAGEPGRAVVEAAHLDRPPAPGTALLLPTSGSTGVPKVVELSAAALLTSARATHARVGPPGRWLLALPLTHVAGWQVLVRGLLAPEDRRVPVRVTGPSTADAVAAALDAADPAVAYASLVPTQLGRLLDSPDATRAASALTVLLGGAAAPAALLDRARRAGLTVVTTYGSTETSGGCVYDGLPLDGVTTSLTTDGRLRLSGPVLATGYRDGSPGFATQDRVRWFTTSDLARLDGGRVEVLGRADDVVVSGGENVSPAAVERVLLEVAGVRDALVVGVPDVQWGSAVVALVVADDGVSDEALRAAVAGRLGRHHAPRHVLRPAAIPQHGIGKPDRRAAAELAARTLPE